MLLTMDLLLIYSRYQIPPKPLLNDVEFPFCPKRTKESLIMDSVASQQISQNFFRLSIQSSFNFHFLSQRPNTEDEKRKEKIEKNFLGHLKKLVNILSAAPKKF